MRMLSTISTIATPEPAIGADAFTVIMVAIVTCRLLAELHSRRNSESPRTILYLSKIQKYSAQADYQHKGISMVGPQFACR